VSGDGVATLRLSLLSDENQSLCLFFDHAQRQEKEGDLFKVRLESGLR
jgi:hypothetical protein